MLNNEEFEHIENNIYLDHAASTLYSKSQIENINKDLLSNIYSNPHSLHTPSKNTTNKINKIREEVLNMFNAKNNYKCIFTRSATDSLKLLGETFPWNSKSNYHYLNDNHNSVIGIREYAISNNSTIKCLKLFSDSNIKIISKFNMNKNNLNNQNLKEYNLIAIPGESNFSGKIYSLDQFFEYKNMHSNSYLLIDAAKMASTSQLDLNKYPADFICISFYKIFGYPTGLGALLIKNDSCNILKKKYFGGGTVSNVNLVGNSYTFKNNFISKMEDGSIPFLSIISLKYGIDIINKLGYKNIHLHTSRLAYNTANILSKLKHKNGILLCKIYDNPYELNFDDYQKEHGSIVTFNLFNSKNIKISFEKINKLANEHNIQFRMGCFCNSGSCLNNNLIKNPFTNKCLDFRIMNYNEDGAIRISFGYMTTNLDITKFINFINLFLE